MTSNYDLILHPQKRPDVTLVTGFGPFGSLKRNPSQSLVEALPSLDSLERTLIVPTSYERAWQQIESALAPPNTRLVMFGYSPRAKGLRLERFAHNLDRSPIPDVDGEIHQGSIFSAAEPRLDSTAAVTAFRHLRATYPDLPVHMSEDAGGYVCNHVFYRALREASHARALGSVVFAHVPDWERSESRGPILEAATRLVEFVGGITVGA